MKKLTKTQVKSLIKKDYKGTMHHEGLHVWLCPSKSSPNIGHPFNVATKLTFVSGDLEVLDDVNGLSRFDKVVNEFTHYNCNSELGNTIHYYIEEN